MSLCLTPIEEEDKLLSLHDTTGDGADNLIITTNTYGFSCG